MTLYDPPAAARQRESGYKGDGWTVTLPDDGADAVVGLDTGLDSLSILRVPNAKWDRGERAPTVHAHADHDETIVIPTGFGDALPGTGSCRTSRRPGSSARSSSWPPAGVWHHVVMDVDAVATGTCFFTVPGTVLVPFKDRTPLNTLRQGDVRGPGSRPAAAGRWPSRRSAIRRRSRAGPAR